ncbi:MAG: hypothetical protein QXJ06_04960 [Candidatus Aenigmatarchaeota archaeon]
MINRETGVTRVYNGTNGGSDHPKKSDFKIRDQYLNEQFINYLIMRYLLKVPLNSKTQ